MSRSDTTSRPARKAADKEALRELFLKFAETGDQAIREELVLEEVVEAFELGRASVTTVPSGPCSTWTSSAASAEGT